MLQQQMECVCVCMYRTEHDNLDTTETIREILTDAEESQVERKITINDIVF